MKYFILYIVDLVTFTSSIEYRIRQNFQGGKLSRFSANHESFPLESLAVHST